MDPNIPARHSFRWNIGENTQIIADQPGQSKIYSVTVTDNVCFATQSVSATVQVNDLEVNIDSIRPTCFDETNGRARVSVTGGSGGYNYMWDNGETTVTATGLSFGEHVVTVTDTSGCERTSSVSITQNPEISLDYT